jgi:hypothetical protein
MHALRTAINLPRLILAWFVMFVAVAGAAPFVQPKVMELVCSADGMVKMVTVGEDGQAQGTNHHTLDCSLCLPFALPSDEPVVSFGMLPRLAPVQLPRATSHVPARFGAPLPARGPPAFA